MAKGRPVIDTTFWILLALLVGLSILTWQRGGAAALGEGLSSGGSLLLRYGLVIVVSFMAAGLAEKLIPTEWVRSTLGDDAGVRGIAIAAAAGMITPSGPFVSMPIAAGMLRAGAAHAAIVAFLASWSLLAIHRFVAWEVPILGLRFALLRWLACAALPILAGLAVRALSRGS